MDELDRDIAELVAVLARIVNRAGRSKATTAAHRDCAVPVALLGEAKKVLNRWNDSEYGTSETKQAVLRLLD